MKRVVFASALCAMGSMVLFAQEEDQPRWYVSPGVGMMFFEGNQPVNEGLNMALRLGYDLADHWSLEGGLSWAPNITSNGRHGHDDGRRGYDLSGQSIRGAFGDVLYHFYRFERFDPFLTAGFGYYRSNNRVFCEGDEFSVCGPRLGLGAMYHLTDRWSVRADFRSFMAIDETCEMTYTGDAGITYWFGGSGEGKSSAGLGGGAAVLAGMKGKKDSDGDGLTDDEESKLGTNPLKKDSDSDGLTDGEEVKTYKTDPLNPDTDCDGLNDGQEVYTYKTNPLERDTDKGGVADGHEVLVDKTSPLDPKDDLMLFEVNIQFGYDRTVIKPEYCKELDSAARALIRNPNAVAVIEGHADRKFASNAKYNQKLSEERAWAVQKYLVSKGADPKRMTVVGYGFTRPKVQPNLVKGNPENRRVEIYIRGAGTNAEKGRYTK